jgi:hypothetical protein
MPHSVMVSVVKVGSIAFCVLLPSGVCQEPMSEAQLTVSCVGTGTRMLRVLVHAVMQRQPMAAMISFFMLVMVCIAKVGYVNNRM